MEYDCGWRPRYTLNTQLHTTQQQRTTTHTVRSVLPTQRTPLSVACAAAQHAETWSAAARRRSSDATLSGKLESFGVTVCARKSRTCGCVGVETVVCGE
mmetsp:Transcript_9053/g.15460  ORF Transcript_9053/g.15460 Transcript_9053/m.15460 type:complete len:99 (+) Transcript_9053:57-353(+)